MNDRWKTLRNWRRAAGRYESMVRWLGLTRYSGSPNVVGLVLIQIDGLSRQQLELAMQRRRMPFLAKLLRRENYKLHTMYSGVPSTTPAVQAELFYGVRCAVPAFCFRDATTGSIVRMVDSDPASSVEADLAAQQPGLLTGGSAYSNIYCGGAGESHFCAATMGWNGMFQQANLLAWAGILLWNWFSIARTFVLMFVEIGIAAYDAVNGIFKGQRIDVELKYIPSRVAVSVGLRELITIGASMDVTRGQKVVQLNFLGYDEQSHRRGPGSLFAHWSLKGIDDAIKRVVLAARRSESREYEVWIYSDHGQEHVVPYDRQFGKPIEQAVLAVIGNVAAMEIPPRPGNSDRQPATRVRWLARWAKRLPGGNGASVSDERPPAGVEIAAVGPVGHIYFENQPEVSTVAQIASQLVATAHIPAVLFCDAQGGVVARTTEGEFSLPRDIAKVVGEAHPFLSELGKDLIKLCHHEDAGTLIFLGTNGSDARPLSFAHENGAHAGPGKHETQAFVLAPATTTFPNTSAGFLRPQDFRLSALQHLGRSAENNQSAAAERGT